VNWKKKIYFLLVLHSIGQKDINGALMEASGNVLISQILTQKPLK